MHRGNEVRKNIRGRGGDDGIDGIDIRANYLKPIGKAYIGEDWAVCPRCGQRLCRVDKGATAHGIYLYCKFCKRDVELDSA